MPPEYVPDARSAAAVTIARPRGCSLGYSTAAARATLGPSATASRGAAAAIQTPVAASAMPAVAASPASIATSAERWLGTTVTVDAILDGPIELEIPAGTQPGAVTTLRGHGMPHLRSGVRGNLHAHVEVLIPTRLDHTDTELLTKLKEHRSRDVAEVKSANGSAAGAAGGLFSRLRETFSGR